MYEKIIKNAVNRGKLTGGFPLFSKYYGIKIKKSEFEALKKELEAAGYKDISWESNPYNAYNVFFTDDKKTFKVNGREVEADSIADAIHQVKDVSIKDYKSCPDYPSRSSYSPNIILKQLDSINEYSKQIDANPENADKLKKLKADLVKKISDNIDHYSKECSEYEKFADEYSEYMSYVRGLFYNHKRSGQFDSEDVEDLATVDKTFLLTLTRKIMSNITSDNFSAAQTQAKELERYINNVRYADSVDDSVKDYEDLRPVAERINFLLEKNFGNTLNEATFNNGVIIVSATSDSAARKMKKFLEDKFWQYYYGKVRMGEFAISNYPLD